jgi:hypothetical protein
MRDLAAWRALKDRILPAALLGLLVLLSLWVALAPAETRLGNLVKLVYVHGALVWAGLGAFSAAGLLGLVALITGQPLWYRATTAAGHAALTVWIVYTLSAMLVTGLAWGQIIAWGEPRVRASAAILLAALALELAIWLVAQDRFQALARILMGIAPWVAVRRAEVIRHPVNPIGGSGSMAMQGYYLLIVLTVGGLVAVVIAWLWARLQLRHTNSSGGNGEAAPLSVDGRDSAV